MAARGLDAPSLRAVPAEWDYVVSDERTVNSPDLFAPETKAFHKTAATYFNMKKACVKRMQRGTPVLCMDPRQLNPKIPEVLRGARLLLDDDFTYEQAVAVYRENVARAGVAQDRFFSFDNVIKML